MCGVSAVVMLDSSVNCVCVWSTKKLTMPAYCGMPAGVTFYVYEEGTDLTQQQRSVGHMQLPN